MPENKKDPKKHEEIQPFLRLVDRHNMHHLLPYGHLLYASLIGNTPTGDTPTGDTPTGDTPTGNTMTLVFAAHTSTITGCRLELIFDRIQAMTVPRISITPRDSAQNALEAKVDSITVEARSE